MLQVGTYGEKASGPDAKSCSSCRGFYHTGCKPRAQQCVDYRTSYSKRHKKCTRMRRSKDVAYSIPAKSMCTKQCIEAYRGVMTPVWRTGIQYDWPHLKDEKYPSRPNTRQIVRLCDYQPAQIMCQPRSFIKILSARYGRPSPRQFAHGCGGKLPGDSTTPCVTEATCQVAQLCDGKEACGSGDGLSVCPSSFPSKAKCISRKRTNYLEIAYKCVPHHVSQCKPCKAILKAHAATSRTWAAIPSHTKLCFEAQKCVSPKFKMPVAVHKADVTFRRPAGRDRYSTALVKKNKPCKAISKTRLSNHTFWHSTHCFEAPSSKNGLNGRLSFLKGRLLSPTTSLQTTLLSDKVCVCKDVGCLLPALRKNRIENRCNGVSAQRGPTSIIATCMAHPSDPCTAMVDGQRDSFVRLQRKSHITLEFGRKHIFATLKTSWSPTSTSDPKNTQPQDAVLFDVECYVDNKWHSVTVLGGPLL